MHNTKEAFADTESPNSPKGPTWHPSTQKFQQNLAANCTSRGDVASRRQIKVLRFNLRPLCATRFITAVRQVSSSNGFAVRVPCLISTPLPEGWARNRRLDCMNPGWWRLGAQADPRARRQPLARAIGAKLVDPSSRTQARGPETWRPNCSSDSQARTLAHPSPWTQRWNPDCDPANQAPNRLP